MRPPKKPSRLKPTAPLTQRDFILRYVFTRAAAVQKDFSPVIAVENAHVAWLRIGELCK